MEGRRPRYWNIWRYSHILFQVSARNKRMRTHQRGSARDVCAQHRARCAAARWRPKCAATRHDRMFCHCRRRPDTPTSRRAHMHRAQLACSRPTCRRRPNSAKRGASQRARRPRAGRTLRAGEARRPEARPRSAARARITPDPDCGDGRGTHARALRGFGGRRGSGEPARRRARGVDCRRAGCDRALGSTPAQERKNAGEIRPHGSGAGHCGRVDGRAPRAHALRHAAPAPRPVLPGCTRT